MQRQNQQRRQQHRPVAVIGKQPVLKDFNIPERRQDEIRRRRHLGVMLATLAALANFAGGIWSGLGFGAGGGRAATPRIPHGGRSCHVPERRHGPPDGRFHMSIHRGRITNHRIASRRRRRAAANR